MNSKIMPEANNSFHSIRNPDEFAQYRNALSIVVNPASVDGASTLSSVDAKYLKTSVPKSTNRVEWLCVSVWRKAVLGTSDDRLSNGQGKIESDLESWDNWLQKCHLNNVKMVSVALLESSDDYPYVSKTAKLTRSIEQSLKSVKLTEQKFVALQGIVDSVSSDMAASHLLWIYRNGIPLHKTAHHRDVFSLSMQLENIIDTQSDIPSFA